MMTQVRSAFILWGAASAPALWDSGCGAAVSFCARALRPDHPSRPCPRAAPTSLTRAPPISLFRPPRPTRVQFGSGESAAEFARGINDIRGGRRAKHMERASKKIAFLKTKARDQKEKLRVTASEADATRLALGKTLEESGRMVQYAQMLRVSAAQQRAEMDAKHCEELRTVRSERDAAQAEAAAARTELRELKASFDRLEESARLQIQQLTSMVSKESAASVSRPASSLASWFG